MRWCKGPFCDRDTLQQIQTNVITIHLVVYFKINLKFVVQTACSTNCTVNLFLEIEVMLVFIVFKA